MIEAKAVNQAALGELDQRQDRLLHELDELNSRIEATLAAISPNAE